MTFVWEDPDDGNTYEMRYIVTQTEDEGPEYVEWRLAPEDPNDPDAQLRWRKLPPWAMPPQEAIEFWHGPVKSYGEAILLVMKPDSPAALCVDEKGELFATDLTLFTNVSNPDGDEVKVGDIIKPSIRLTLQGVSHLSDWLQS